MGRRDHEFNSRRYERGQEIRLLLGFVALLYVVGGALIWHFYGAAGAVLGLSCATIFLVVLALLYALIVLVGRWAGE